MQSLRTALALVFGLLLAPSLGATWSIIIVDTRTGEIAVGSATCLTTFNLRQLTPVIVVGRGAATAQARLASGITNRAVIWEFLQLGTAPSTMLNRLAMIDPGHRLRQYGIVDTTGRAATFTGSAASAWAGGVTGSVGTIHYAIQGNILTGQPVVAAAEEAVRNTPGDLAEKLMAGMEAARAFGGDGRCSCPAGPTACGSPPPSFTKSAHIGYVIVARQGDTDGTCNSTATGCATGSYWLNLNVPFQPVSAPDPVLQLREMFNQWRGSLVGRPDHHLSTVTPNPASLIPDGQSTTAVTVALRDWQGTPLTAGGATTNVTLDPSSTAMATIGSVVDNGDGTYTFPVTAGNAPGTVQLRIAVDDGSGEVLLSPRTAIDVRADALWADTATLSSQVGGPVNFTLDAGAPAAGRAHLVLMSGSGTAPGVTLPGGLPLALNLDPFFQLSLVGANSSVFVGTLGTLDGSGRGSAAFAVPGGGFLRPLIGADLDFAYVLLNPLDLASNPVRVTVIP